MPMRVIHIQPKTKAGALALGAGVVVVGAVLVVVGLSLLLALTAGGLIAGTGYALYRRITGRGVLGAPRRGAGVGGLGLDPRLEVKPGPGQPGSTRVLPDSTSDRTRDE